MPVGTSRNRALARVVLLLGVVQLALFLYFFSSSIHPMPRWDFFDWVTGYLETSSLLPWLWEQHNEHRVVGSKLAAAMDVEFFRGRMYPVALVALAGLFGWVSLVARAVLRAADLPAGMRAWAVGCLLLLSFPTTTLDTYTYPTNLQFGLVSFFFVLAVVAMRPGPAPGEPLPVRRLVLTIGAALACTLSSANGLFVWPVLLWSAWRQRLRAGWGVAVVGAAISVLYLLDYHRPSSTALYVNSPADLAKFAQYFVAYFGMPWVTVPSLYAVGMVLGLTLVLAGGAAAVWRGLVAPPRGEIERIGVALLLFGGATGLVTSFGRLHLTGLPAHRYAVFSQLAQIGLFLLFLAWAAAFWKDESRRRWLLSATVGLGLVLLVQQVVVGRFASSRAEHFASIRDQILAGNRDPAITKEIYPHAGRLEHHLRLYDKERIYLYREAESPARDQIDSQ